MAEGIPNHPKEVLKQTSIDAIREIIEPIPNAYDHDKVSAIVEREGSRVIQILLDDLKHAPKGQLKKAVEAWYQKFEKF